MTKIPIDDKLRALVQRLVGFGLRLDEIALATGVSARTLQRRCARELENGAPLANSGVLNSLYRLALDGNVAACIFWAKTRCGWREVARTELTGADGVPLAVQTPTLNIIQEVTAHPSAMSDADLAACAAEYDRRQRRH